MLLKPLTAAEGEVAIKASDLAAGQLVQKALELLRPAFVRAENIPQPGVACGFDDLLDHLTPLMLVRLTNHVQFDVLLPHATASDKPADPGERPSMKRRFFGSAGGK